MKIIQKAAVALTIVFGVLLILGSYDNNGEEKNLFYIPKTGQTLVYSQYDDGYYQSGTKRDFQKYDDYVGDSVSGISWEDSPHVNTLMTYEDAYKYCSNLEWGGFSNWRLPMLFELLNLIDHSKVNPAAEPIFENMPSGERIPFWSSSSQQMLYTVDFNIGTTEIPAINRPSAYVRCVRSYYFATVSRNIESNRTLQVVEDKDTGLIWQDDNSSFTNHTWEESIRYCEDLVHAGYTDWRLPNINELASIVSVSIKNNFSNLPSQKTLWSSTTVHLDNSRAFVLVLDETAYHTFEIDYTNKYGAEMRLDSDVRCVRGGSLFGGEQNRPPTADSQSLQVEKNTPKDITLHGTDPEHARLYYTITKVPENGILTGNVPNITYTPHTDYIGSDSFKFKVNDGELDSSEATVDLTISESLAYSILRTGQITSYVPYDDGYYQKGAYRNFSRDDTKQIVTDNVNGLIWQDNNETKTIKKDKEGADRYCTDLVFADYDDWRVPSVEELMTLTNKAETDPAIEKKFENTASDFYMTSTTDKTEENGSATDTYRWLVDFNWGATSTTRNESFTDTFYVRCVRGSASGLGQFERDDAKGVVIDRSTGLMWQDDENISNRHMAWPDAIDYCENLVEAEYTNWRLPNFNELFSIWDRSRNAWEANATAINPAFKYTSGFGFWSSTSNHDYTDLAWINLYNGSASIDMPQKTDSIPSVRCVRDIE